TRGRRRRRGPSRRRAPRPATPGSRPVRAVLQHGGPFHGGDACRAGGGLRMPRRADFRPFATRGRRPILAILLTFALFSTLSVISSISATKRSQHRASVVEVAARQRTLAERYVKEVLLAREGARVDPRFTASILARSADALLNGGTAPPVYGDDDETKLSSATDAT